MSGAAHNLDHEYWRPPAQAQAQALPAGGVTTEVCPRCGTEFVMGGRYCHVCGAQREAVPDVREPGLTRFLDFRVLCESLGLSIGSLVAFIVGIACVLATVGTGFVYTATTVLDWQAVQVWRIEWLLGATAAFLAGILLKRNR